MTETRERKMTEHILDDWSDARYEASAYLMQHGFTPHTVQDEPCTLYEKNLKNEVLVQVYLYDFATNVEIHSLDGTTYSPQIYRHGTLMNKTLDEAIDAYNEEAKPLRNLLPQINKETITIIEESNDNHILHS